jgi:hypothetical protein
LKILIVIVCVAGLGAVGGAVYVGASLKEPTVVPDPYQAGLQYDEHHRQGRATPGKAVTASAASTPSSTPTPTVRSSATAAVPPTSTAAPAPTATVPPTPCDLQNGPCTQPLPGGGEATLAVEPRPLRAMRELQFTLTVTPASAAAGAEAALVLIMPGMYMGEMRTALMPAGEGVFRGKGVVVRCASGRRDWVAEVVLARAGRQANPGEGASRAARFPFTVSE